MNIFLRGYLLFPFRNRGFRCLLLLATSAVLPTGCIAVQSRISPEDEVMEEIMNNRPKEKPKIWLTLEASGGPGNVFSSPEEHSLKMQARRVFAESGLFTKVGGVDVDFNVEVHYAFRGGPAVATYIVCTLALATGTVFPCWASDYFDLSYTISEKNRMIIKRGKMHYRRTFAIQFPFLFFAMPFVGCRGISCPAYDEEIFARPPRLAPTPRSSLRTRARPPRPAPTPRWSSRTRAPQTPPSPRRTRS